MQHPKYPLASMALRDFIHYTDAILSDFTNVAQHLRNPDLPDEVREDIERSIDMASRAAGIVSNMAGLSCSLDEDQLLARKNFKVMMLCGLQLEYYVVQNMGAA